MALDAILFWGSSAGISGEGKLRGLFVESEALVGKLSITLGSTARTLSHEIAKSTCPWLVGHLAFEKTS